MGIYLIERYNCGFLGTWRCDKTEIDGHYLFLVSDDNSEFTAIKMGGYGEFTSFPKVELIPMDYTQSSIEYLHDIIYDKLHTEIVLCEEMAMIDIWNRSKHYKLHKNAISKNIHHRDAITNLLTGEKITVNKSQHDLLYFNKNYWWKLNRRDDHAEMMSLNEFKDILNKIDPFREWNLIDCKPKKSTLLNWYIIRGIDFKVYYDASDIYYLEFSDKVYSMRNSNLYLNNTIDILKGHVYSSYNHISGTRSEYNIYESLDVKYKEQFGNSIDHIFNDKKSYWYNNRLVNM